MSDDFDETTLEVVEFENVGDRLEELEITVELLDAH